MKIVDINNVDIDKVVDVLKKGGLIIYPTETVYGIGADATNKDAIEKLNRYKKRPAGKPYSVAVSNIDTAKKYVYINKTAEKIYRSLLPGPVTVVSKSKHNLAPGVESESGTLGIRIPDYKLIIDIAQKFGKPFTSTSANASYKKRPYKISDILENISTSQKKMIDLIIDAGSLPHNEPSTVVDTTSDEPTILRQGDISLSSKNEILSRSEEETKNFAKNLWQKYENHSGNRAIVFALIGEMGSGKTIFTKGLAKAIGIQDIITSPTFNLEQTYVSPNSGDKLVHIDTWRMTDASELDDLNFAKNIDDKSIVSVEWADKFIDKIKKYNDEAIVVWVKLSFGKTENERLINWGIFK